MTEEKARVLCIDDDPDVLEHLKITLENNGYQPVFASCAEEGLRSFRESPADLIVVDLMMEEIDAGTQFCEELAKEGCKAPIYMLSSMGNKLRDNINPAELGITGVLQKPLNTDAFLKILKQKLS